MTIADDEQAQAISDAEEVLMRIDQLTQAPILSLLSWAEGRSRLDSTIVSRLEAGGQAIARLMHETVDAVHDLIEAMGLQLPEQRELSYTWPPCPR